MSDGILYISYDGMLEPLGQSQVLAYLERLAQNRPIHLISFEKAHDWHDAARRISIKERIAAARIRWHPLRYHRRPTAPATAYDIVIGTAVAVAIARRNRLGIVHARSYVAALIALTVKRVTGAKFLFDMRGLWADERVDGGLWPAGGRLYWLAKSLERRLLASADHVVTLTNASAAEITRFDLFQGREPPITVIPTCADLDRFAIQGAPQRDPFVLGYVGSVGTWYLLDEMLYCFRLLREARPEAQLLMINRGEHELIRNRASACGLDPLGMEIIAAEHRDVPGLIGRMSAGMALYKPSYSRIACAPTKLAEYLGSGVPVIANRGVGDMAETVERHRVGAVLSGFSDNDLRDGIQAILALVDDSDLQRRCHETAVQLFSLDAGAMAYEAIYGGLGS